MRTKHYPAIVAILATLAVFFCTGCADKTKKETPASTMLQASETATETTAEITTSATTSTTTMTWLRNVKEATTSAATNTTSEPVRTRQATRTTRTEAAGIPGGGNAETRNSNTENTAARSTNATSTKATSTSTKVSTSTAPTSTSTTATTVISSTKTEPENGEIIYGDVNRDRRVDVYDLTLMKHEYIEPNEYDIFRPALDVNGNGVFDIDDIREVLDFLLGKRDRWSRDGGTVVTTTSTSTTTTTSSTSTTTTTATTTTSAATTTSSATETTTTSSSATSTTTSTEATTTSTSTTSTASTTTTTATTTTTSSTSASTTTVTETTSAEPTTASTTTSSQADTTTTTSSSATSTPTGTTTTTTVIATDTTTKVSSGPGTGGLEDLETTTTTTEYDPDQPPIVTIAPALDIEALELNIPTTPFTRSDVEAEVYYDSLWYFGDEPENKKPLDDFYHFYCQHSGVAYDLDAMMYRFGFVHDGAHSWTDNCISYIHGITKDEIFFYSNGCRVLKLGDFVYFDNRLIEDPNLIEVTSGTSKDVYMMAEFQFRRTFNLIIDYYNYNDLYDHDALAGNLEWELDNFIVVDRIS